MTNPAGSVEVSSVVELEETNYLIAQAIEGLIRAKDKGAFRSGANQKYLAIGSLLNAAYEAIENEMDS